MCEGLFQGIRCEWIAVQPKCWKACMIRNNGKRIDGPVGIQHEQAQ